MSTKRFSDKLNLRVLLLILVVVAVLAAWYLAFFKPQTQRLESLQAQRTSLEATVAQDDAHLAQLRTESAHVAQIQAMVGHYEADVPASPQLYTYVKTIARAAKVSGVSITSLSPGSLISVTNTRFSAVPITATVKGSYAQLLVFLRALYALPRLTGINAVSLSSGGPGGSNSATLSATFQLAIYTTQQIPTTSAG